MLTTPISTIGTVAPSPAPLPSLDNRSAVHHTRVNVYSRDSTVTRIRARPVCRPSSTPTTPRTNANTTANFSRRSRRTLKLRIRNIQEFQSFATLNFGSVAPTDDRETKRCLDRIKTWLVRRRCALVWKLEFTTDTYRPHFHLLIRGDIDTNALRDQWAKIVGAEPSVNLVHIERIRDHAAVLSYIVKGRDHPANHVPPDYRNMGRFHGSAGIGAPDATLTLEGTETELAPIVRVLNRIVCARAVNGRTRPDRGVYSMTLWTIGAEVANDLQRYWNSLRRTESVDA